MYDVRICLRPPSHIPTAQVNHRPELGYLPAYYPIACLLQ